MPAASREVSGAVAAHASAYKICLIGEPGVGKTSLAQRWAAGRFPPEPTGPGIRIWPTQVEIAGRPVPVTIWDVAAASAVDTLSQAFLRDADAIVAVAPAGDAGAVAHARALLARARALTPGAAGLLLLNKCEPPRHPEPLPAEPDLPIHCVSARDGFGTEAALVALLARLRRPLRRPA